MTEIKHILSLILALVLGLLSGCVTAPDNTTTGKKPSIPIVSDAPQNETTAPPSVSATYYLPEKVDAPDGIPVLKWFCLGAFVSDTASWAQDAAIEINRVLAEKEMPFRLQFVLYSDSKIVAEQWFSDSNVPAELSEADIIHGYFTEEIAKQYLQPITNYANGTASPALTQAVPHEIYWNLSTFSGEIYGIRSWISYPYGNGWIVDDTVISEWGYSTADFEHPFWEMDALFAQIYEKNQDKPFLWDQFGNASGFGYGSALNDYHPASFNSQLRNQFQLIGSCFAIDYSTGTPTVVNYLETTYARNCQAALRRYREAGYLTTDPNSILVNYGTVYNNGISLSAEENSYRISGQQLHFGGPQGSEPMNGISATTKHREEALALLSLIAYDEAFRELVLFGVEGQDYVLTESGAHATITQKDGSSYNMGFLSVYSSLYGAGADPMILTEEGASRLETHQESLSHSLPMCNIIFDFTTVAEGTAAVNTILGRTKQEDKEKDPPVLFARFGNLTEAEYDQMLAEIRAAGGDKIQAELQRQLDEWLKANPNWQNP